MPSRPGIVKVYVAVISSNNILHS